MRCTYGPDQPYTHFAAHSLKLWQKYQGQWKRPFFHPTGVLWMIGSKDDTYERGSLKVLRDAKVKFSELSAMQMKKRWPQIDFSGIHWGLFEPESGYLDARSSCQAVAEVFIALGGAYLQTAVLTEGLEEAPLRSVRLSDGSRLKADVYVFACGPWLGGLFPQTLGNLIQSTKQEVFFFGIPAGDPRFNDTQIPVWGDHGERFFYGIPGNYSRGFKVADDSRGEEFDPTSGERVANPETLNRVRNYVDARFPDLKHAPLIETRVCQYEQTPDSNFIVDRHPQMENVWLVGGGSGHGFKHGPAIGDLMAQLIVKDANLQEDWRLSRFTKMTRP